MTSDKPAPAPSDPRLDMEARIFLPQHNWKWFMLRGLIAIALGIAALIFPGFTILTFAMIFAAFSFVDGLFSLISGLRGARDHAERWWALALSGVAGLAVGVIFFIWPLVATTVYAFLLVALIAVWALVTGALEIAAAVRLRKAMEGEIMLGLAGALSMALAIALFAIMMTSPGATILSLGWLIGAYLLASGVALTALAFRLRRGEY